MMEDLNVRIVTLEPMRMVSSYGFGKEPEDIAWKKMKAFIERNNMDESTIKSTFGFNNPDPSAGSPNYGYEIWLPVDHSIDPDEDLRIVDFSGGLYAVTTFKGLHKIGDVWHGLVKWMEGSKYKFAYHQCLEELTSGPELPPEEFVFNLYLPIAEKVGG
jgi:effector-binding domain-containing protein